MTLSGTRTTTYALAAAAVAALAAGCGGGSSSAGGTQSISPAAAASSSSAASASTPATASPPASPATSTHSTSIGTVLASPTGRTIYELVGDTAANSMCSSSCESIWPPVMSGGKLLVVHGHPAFTFSGDSQAGQANGEGSKDSWGTWLALRPDGTAIPAKAAAPTTVTPTKAATPAAAKSGSGGGGGYGY